MNTRRTCSALLLSMLLLMGLTPFVLAQPADDGSLQRSLDAYAAGRLADARRGFETLARDGSAVARFNLAVMHLRGELPQASAARARELLEQSARQGFVTAMFTLGQAWEGGEFGRLTTQGIPALAESLAWYERAASAGSADAQVATATAYYLGRGVRQDRAAAARWYREAAKAGDVGAQYLVASMYEAGDGLQQDLRLARYWYDVAAKNGDVAAPGKVRELDARLGSPAEPPATPTARP
jgi:uncharacterized protein